jgi:hypothetical protein
MDMVSELLYWCSYGKCYIREQKDARPRVDAVTATTSNRSTIPYDYKTDTSNVLMRLASECIWFAIIW